MCLGASVSAVARLTSWPYRQLSRGHLQAVTVTPSSGVRGQELLLLTQPTGEKKIEESTEKLKNKSKKIRYLEE